MEHQKNFRIYGVGTSGKQKLNAEIDLLLAEYCKKSFALMDNFGWRLIVMMLTFISKSQRSSRQSPERAIQRAIGS